jgi:hypothetical protein
MMNFASRSIFVHTLNGFLTCEILRHMADGFISLQGRRVADFYRPWPGLNRRTLGAMTSTLTITSTSEEDFNVEKYRAGFD